jgi:hypothetical protein
MHSPEAFLDEVISSYHYALGISRVPGPIEQFRTRTYQDPPEGLGARSGDVALLVRLLREMQQTLWSYEKT